MSTKNSQNLTEGPNQSDDPSRVALHVQDVIVQEADEKILKQFSDPYRVDCVTIAVVLVLVGGIVVIILALLGPAIGNVFSTIVVGI